MKKSKMDSLAKIMVSCGFFSTVAMAQDFIDKSNEKEIKILFEELDAGRINRASAGGGITRVVDLPTDLSD